MRLVIVGSMGKAWTISEEIIVRNLIHKILYDRTPTIVGSGESPAGGVDIWVHEVCDRLGLPFKAFPPRARIWPAYRERDQQMADWCTHLVRIKSVRSKTYGSGWTRDRAREQGKPTEEVVPNA